MATPIQLDSKKWFVQVRLKGKSFSHTARTRLECEKWQSDLRTNATLTVPAPAKQAFSELRRLYLLSDPYLNKEDTTRAVEFRNTQAVVDHLDCYVEDLTVDHVIEYKRARLATVSKKTKKCLSRTKVRLEMACLSSMLSHAQFLKWISFNPAVHVSRPPGHKDRRTDRCSPEDVLQMLVIAQRYGEQVYWFYVLFFILGCRPSEIFALARSQINLHTREITLYHTKGKFMRIMVIPEAFFAGFSTFLQRRDPAIPYVFFSRTRAGEPKAFDYYNYWRKITKSVQFAVPYNLRHERITRWIEDGASDSVAMRLAGHRTILTTQIYNHHRALSSQPEVNATMRKDLDRLSQGLSGVSPASLAESTQLLVDIKRDADGPVPVIFPRTER